MGVDEKLIISIEDFRRLAGRATAHFSDEQVTEFIRQLDFLADMYVKRAVPRKENADKVESET